jgi:hypothetical protein
MTYARIASILFAIEFFAFIPAIIGIGAVMGLISMPTQGLVFNMLAIFSSFVLTAYYAKIKGLLRVNLWKSRETLKADLQIVAGHLGVAGMAYMLYPMFKAGIGSGVPLLPFVIWSAIFYTTGIRSIMTTLNSP